MTEENKYPAIGAKLLKRHRNLPHWEAGGGCYHIDWHVMPGLELAQAERAVVLDHLLKFHEKRLFVSVAIVMPDHVHALLRPLEKSPGVWWSLSELTAGMKGASARSINARRDRRGAVWQDESFDHLIRNLDDYTKNWLYIVRNPVVAALCKTIYEYDSYWIAADNEGRQLRKPETSWRPSDATAARNGRATG